MSFQVLAIILLGKREREGEREGERGRDVCFLLTVSYMRLYKLCSGVNYLLYVLFTQSELLAFSRPVMQFIY